MQRSFFMFFAWVGCAVVASAGLLPLTASDIGLMLRSGYSSAAVSKELEKRHLLAPLDDAQRQNLIKSGASPELIAAIDEGKYLLSDDASAQAQQRMDDLAQRHAAVVKQEKEAEARYLARLQKDRAAATAQWRFENATVEYLKGALVRCRNGKIVPAEDDAVANKKYILYYYSASWCAPCRQFTPQLVDWYKRVTEKHPEVEIVLYSSDRSAAAMEKYMSEENMAWLAVDYGKRAEKELLAKTGGNAIPTLVLVERTGKLLSRSGGDTKKTPANVLADMDAILNGGAATVAQTN